MSEGPIEMSPLDIHSDQISMEWKEEWEHTHLQKRIFHLQWSGLQDPRHAHESHWGNVDKYVAGGSPLVRGKDTKEGRISDNGRVNMASKPKSIILTSSCMLEDIVPTSPQSSLHRLLNTKNVTQPQAELPLALHDYNILLEPRTCQEIMQGQKISLLDP